MTERIRQLAASISPQTIAACSRRRSVADENEAKYANVRDAELALTKELDGGIAARYEEIHAGTDNGECTTRRGTYCKIMYGNGRGRV